VLAALLASLSLLAHPVGAASATTQSGLSADIRYGCDTGDGLGEFVEVTVRSGSQTVDPDNAQIVQVGLARSKNDTDSYADGSGPTLIALRGAPKTVRLAGTPAGAHVFLRGYKQTSDQDFPLPSSCTHITKTDFGLQDPDVYFPSSHASCVGSTATLKVMLMNNSNAAVDYTLLQVQKGGALVGSTPQGVISTVPANGSLAVPVSQPYTGSQVYEYELRVISPDADVVAPGRKTVQCESTGGGGGGTTTPSPVRSTPLPTPTPVRGSTTPSRPRPTTSVPVKSTPGSRPSLSPTVAHNTASGTSPGSNGAVAPGGASGNSGGPSSDGSAGPNTGPVLGEAASTSQSRRPVVSASPTKQVIVESALSRVPILSRNPGFAAASLLVLLAFSCAIAALVATNRASARRR
jgi:hypothetical protein